MKDSKIVKHVHIHPNVYTKVISLIVAYVSLGVLFHLNYIMWDSAIVYIFIIVVVLATFARARIAHVITVDEAKEFFKDR